MRCLWGTTLTMSSASPQVNHILGCTGGVVSRSQEVTEAPVSAVSSAELPRASPGDMDMLEGVQ